MMIMTMIMMMMKNDIMKMGMIGKDGCGDDDYGDGVDITAVLL